jgi:thiaminase
MMNTKIKELDKEAQEYARKIAGNNEDSNYTEWFNVYKEKFAELIVKECSGIVQNYMSRWPEDHELTKIIKAHFGVKE